MGIFGIGTDIVKFSRISAIAAKYETRFACRILSASELDKYNKLTKSKTRFLAKRFAAKEAIAKALGTGFRDQVQLKQMAIDTNDLGKPYVTFYGPTKEFVSKLGDISVHISISDEDEYVLAFVIITE